MMNKTEAKNRIIELIDVLNKASDFYYNKNQSMMSDFEYDKLYDELVRLEEEFEIHLSNSPTKKVGAEVSDALPKIRHEKQMLSLDKTKSREVLRDFLADKDGVLSYKLDGLTVVLIYENGELDKGITRGNGEIGELVTNNVKNFQNVPLKIPFKGHLVIRGEAIIKYSDFNVINETITDVELKYKNPRNLCSGSVRQLDPKITKDRKVNLVAFSLVEISASDNDKKYSKDDIKKINSHFTNQMDFLSELGFEVVLHKEVNRDNIYDAIDFFENDIKTSDYPSDGLVLIYNDIEYGLSLGTTAKFPRNALAFKWQDELAETTLREIEWSASRTGLINPVAIFDPVELEGTTVKRASLHNISIMEELQIGIGDKIKVYKANMIIPQIAENITKSNNLVIPKKCPVCGGDLKIKNENGVKTLICENPECAIKHIKSFENFVSRNCMDIEGISIATIEKFIELGIIKEYADMFKLKNHKDVIVNLDGFGEKSYKNIIDAVDSKRDTECFRVINSLGILGIGTANAKVLSKHFYNDINKIINATVSELTDIDTIGPILANNIVEFFSNSKNKTIVKNLLSEIKIKTNDGSSNNNALDGKIFVITGSLNQYVNRDELVKVIESCGGKVSNSVSSKTNYLINNDTTSNSTKNKKAKELNVTIIDENQFKEMIQ